MSKCDNFTKEQLQEFCDKSESYRDLKCYIGYKPDGGGGTNQVIKEIINKYDLNTSHFKGQGHRKNVGKYRVPIEKYLNNEIKIQSYKLRNRLLKEGYFEYKCSCYGLSEWLGNPIPLELHHKDGNKNNNSLENLELRCPNCHYFTDTYKSKNRAS